MCGQPVEWKENPNRPFCSERCKLIDFGGWVNEEYSVPSEEVPLSEETNPGTNAIDDGDREQGDRR